MGFLFVKECQENKIYSLINLYILELILSRFKSERVLRLNRLLSRIQCRFKQETFLKYIDEKKKQKDYKIEL